MTIQQIFQDKLTIAIKEKNVFEKDLIRVILAEFSREGKDLTDEKAIKILNKICSDMKTTNTDQSLKERDYIKLFLPQEFTKEEVNTILGDIIYELNLDKSPKNIGILKKEFEKRHPGQDGKVIGTFCKELLS